MCIAIRQRRCREHDTSNDDKILISVWLERMAKVCFPNVSWPALCTCRRSITCGRRKALPLRQVLSLHSTPKLVLILLYYQEESSRHCTKTRSTIIAISGASIFRRIHGSVSRRKSGQLRVRATGKHPPTRLWIGSRVTYPQAYRMAMWKHYIVLFGGFYDPGIKSKLHIKLPDRTMSLNEHGSELPKRPVALRHSGV